MKAKIDERFVIDVLNPHLLTGEDEIKVTYNSREYPELDDYLKERFFQQKPIFYKDELQECRVFLRAASFVLKMILFDDGESDDIELNELVYGEIAKEVPLEERQDFIENQAYGKIEVQKIEERG